jgi:inhibitor of cysteine peptidase
MAEILLTDGQNGGVISAKVGDVLTVQLPEIPTTGFRWTSAAEFSGLTLEQDDFQLGAPSSVGGGGLHRWRFTAKRAGITHLEFRLARPWESGSPKAVYRVQVQVS